MKITIFFSTGGCAFFALRFILPLQISLSRSSCTEFILPALPSLLDIFALSPFLPWCLSFRLLSHFSALLQITLCEREHVLSCSTGVHTPPSSNQVLYWLGLRCRAGIFETFWSFLSCCCISSFFSYPLCRWIWKSEENTYIWVLHMTPLWFVFMVSWMFASVLTK